MNRIDLDGRRAVVTGGAQGIGRAIAKRLLASGASVTLWDRDPAQLEETRRELGGTTAGVVVDVADWDDVARAADETIAAGVVDILVNNAGIAGQNATTWEYPVDEWRRVMAIDLDGVFFCCRAVVPHMIERSYGRIVNIASIAGKEGNPNASAYSAAKAGVIARQGARRSRHRGQLHHTGRRSHPDLRAGDAGAHRLHAVEDPARAVRARRGVGGARGVARVGGEFLHHRRRLRRERGARHVLIGGGPGLAARRLDRDMEGREGIRSR